MSANKEENKFVFSRFERNGIIVLCALILISIISKKYVTKLFAKDYQITEADKAKIAQLQQQINEAKTSYAYNNNYSDKKEYAKKDNIESFSKDKQYQAKKDYYDFTIEVNSATQEDYERLYGIGKVYAERIVKFRDRLGGFYSVNQIKDVFGIEDSTFQKFKKNLTIKPVKIKKININTASFEELSANPYFFSTVAKQIIGYRTKVKPFASVNDIKNLYFVRDHPEQFDKLSPYVEIN
ncbi:MAG: helix-hairpin-helix domain-containing protein [Chitinophagales bacterium]